MACDPAGNIATYSELFVLDEFSNEIRIGNHIIIRPEFRILVLDRVITVQAITVSAQVSPRSSSCQQSPAGLVPADVALIPYTRL